MTLELGLIIALFLVVFFAFLFQNSKYKSLSKTIKEVNESSAKRIHNLLANIEESNKTIKENKKLLDNLAENVEGEQQDLIAKISLLSLRFDDENEKFTTRFNELKFECKTDISKLNELLLSYNEILSKQLIEQGKLIRLLSEQNKEFKRKLEIFTEIEADSKELNTNEDINKQEEAIEEALRLLNTKIGTSTKIVDNEESANNKPLTPNDVQPTKTNTENSFTLDEEQSRAYNLMENTNDNFFITGKAGTGKSFLLRLFVRGTKKKVLKIAPTGIAALNIDGSTIHTLFGFYNLEEISIEELNKFTMRMHHTTKIVLKQTEVLVIDEISMVRADILDKIEKMLRIIMNNDELFGGKQIIVFGDMFQLPPISSKEEMDYLIDKYGGVHFFNANAYQEANFHFIELCTNHRQEKDAKFFEILNHIREGVVKNDEIATINERVETNTDTLRRIIRLFPRRSDAEQVNNEELQKIPAKEYKYNAIVEYNKYNSQNVIIENYFQAVSTLRLKVGALVVMTRNDMEHRWVNGTLAIISKLEEDKIEVTINGRSYPVMLYDWEMKEAVYRNGEIEYDKIFCVKQYPIMLGYAMTIHKSQGTTYKHIACDPSDCFAPGQAYVALSRCSSLEGLHLLNPFYESNIKVDASVKDFYLREKTKLLGDKELSNIGDLAKKRGWEKVEFIEETHQYFIDGIEVPNVTKIVDTLSAHYGWDDYSKINPIVLKKAAEQGSKLHKEIEEYELNGKISDSQEFENYLKIKELKGFQVLENEQIVVISKDKKPVAVGRLDMIAELDGKISLLDIKRTSKLYPLKVALQLNLYRIGYQQGNNKKVYSLGVIRLKDNVKEFRNIEIDESSAWKYLDEYYKLIGKKENT